VQFSAGAILIFGCFLPICQLVDTLAAYIST
jgi:hypothetical protein